jgi:hypothetical protein
MRISHHAVFYFGAVYGISCIGLGAAPDMDRIAQAIAGFQRFIVGIKFWPFIFFNGKLFSATRGVILYPEFTVQQMFRQQETAMIRTIFIARQLKRIDLFRIDIVQDQL